MNTAEQQAHTDEQELEKLRSEVSEPEQLAEDSPSSEDNEEAQVIPDEVTPEETPEENREEDSQEAEPVVGEQDSDLSQRAQKRFKDLNDRLRTSSEEAERLRNENENLTAVVQSLQDQGYSRQDAQDIAPQINQDNVSDDNYRRDIALQAKRIVDSTITEREILSQRREAAERLKDDIGEVEKKYSYLNEDSPEYDDKLSSFVAELYTHRIQRNPRIRITDIVKEVASLRERVASESERKKVDKLTKQAASQALSPSGGKTETESITDKINKVDSEEELEALRGELPLDT